MELGPYLLTDLLGEGGCGQVYRALHRSLDRVVALKVIKPGTLVFALDRTRFLREQQLMSRLKFPYLVKFLDSGIVQDVPFLAMELVDGGSLEVLGRGGRTFSWLYVASVGQSVAMTLDYLHQSGLIHRDIKPSNVLLDRGGIVRVADLGLALREGNTRITAVGHLVGTIGYVAPECFWGAAPTPRIDLYSLGRLMQKLLTGSLQTALPKEAADTPPDFLQLLEELTATDPQSRPASAASVNTRLNSMRLRFGDFDLDESLARGYQSILSDTHAVVPDVPVAVGVVAAGRACRRCGKVILPGPDAKTVLVCPLCGGGLLELPDPTTAPTFFKEPRRKRRRRVRFVMESRAFRGAVVATGVSLAMILAMWVRLDGPHPPSRPQPSHPAPQPVVKTSAFDRWRQCEPLLPLLHTEEMDSATHRALVQACRIDLGFHGSRWSYWVRLGHWLADPNRSSSLPIRPAGRHHTELTDDVETAIARQTWREESRETRKLLAYSLSRTAEFPSDGLGWLGLASVLDGEGDTAGAAILYRRALKLLRPGQMSGWPAQAWTAFARAVIATPGADFDTEWMAMLKPAEDDEGAFPGLEAALASDARRYEHVLIRCCEARCRRGSAALALGARYQGKERFAEAEKIFASALDDASPSPELANRLVQLRLRRGDIAAAREVARTHPPSPAWAEVLTLTGDPSSVESGAPKAPPSGDPWADLVVCVQRVRSHLELGQVTQAVTTLDSFEVVKDYWPAIRGNLRLGAVLDVLATGVRNPRLVAEAERSLFGSLDMRARVVAWQDASAALSIPTGTPLMEQWWERARGENVLSTTVLDRLESYWLSRRGHLVTSLKEWCGGSLGASTYESIELLSRPIWYEVLGISPEPSSAPLARELAHSCGKLPDPIPGFAEYWPCLVRGDLAKASQMVIKMQTQESFPSPLNVLRAWSAAATLSGTELNRTMAECRILTRATAAKSPIGWILAELDLAEHAAKVRLAKGH